MRHWKETAENQDICPVAVFSSEPKCSYSLPGFLVHVPGGAGPQQSTNQQVQRLQSSLEPAYTLRHCQPVFSFRNQT